MRRFAEDRFALLSRLHDPSYRFSPFGKGVISGSTDGDQGKNVPWLLERLEEVPWLLERLEELQDADGRAGRSRRETP